MQNYYFSKRNKLPCFVTEGIGICPKCKRTTTNTSITYISKRKREVPISTHLCTKCNTYVFSHKLFQTYKESLIDLYSQALAQQSSEPVQRISGGIGRWRRTDGWRDNSRRLFSDRFCLCFILAAYYDCHIPAVRV